MFKMMKFAFVKVDLKLNTISELYEDAQILFFWHFEVNFSMNLESTKKVWPHVLTQGREEFDKILIELMMNYE